MSDRLTAAINAAACNTLGQIGSSLVDVAAWTLWAPKVAATAITGAGAANLAYEYGCGEMDLGEAPNNSTQQGCSEVSEGGMEVWRAGGSNEGRVAGNVTGWYVEDAGVPHPTPGWTYWQAYIQTSIGGSYVPVESAFWSLDPGSHFEGRPFPNSVCGQENEKTPQPVPSTDPYTYTDPETNCQLEVNLLGFAETYKNGPPQLIYSVKSPDEQRASGGRMGGCVFPESIVITPPSPSSDGTDGPNGPPNGPPTVVPYPPTPPPDGPDGEPWWADYAKAALQGVVAGTVEEIIERLLPTETFPSTIYRHVSVCEKDAEGESISKSVDVPVAGGTAGVATVSRLDALVELLQAHKDFKQPTCGPEKQTIEGDWRTISFISDDTSPYGKSRLRKRFRYRSTSGWTDDQLIDHWKDFSWTSGPVVVKHLGAPWGAPQVWADSADEGKRVIRHAAGEAGLDPDQVGRWEVGSARGARLGVSDTMRVCTKGGYYWITARDGSDYRPQVGLVPQP